MNTPRCNAPRCPKCHNRAKLTRQTYAGKVAWTCKPCDMSIGCHPGTTKPLGSLADKPLRMARQDAHAAFDRLWKAKMRRDKVPKPTARRAAYKWLGEQMGLPKAKCHIAMMNITQCRHVVAICKPYHAENIAKPTEAEIDRRLFGVSFDVDGKRVDPATVFLDGKECP